MTREQLYDGPLDGLVIDAVPSPHYWPSVDVLETYPRSVNARYERRADGRLYLTGSLWEVKG